MRTLNYESNSKPTGRLLIGGVEDHVHVLCQLSRKVAIMDVVKKAKTETAKWLKKQSASGTVLKLMSVMCGIKVAPLGLLMKLALLTGLCQNGCMQINIPDDQYELLSQRAAAGGYADVSAFL